MGYNPNIPDDFKSSKTMDKKTKMLLLLFLIMVGADMVLYFFFCCISWDNGGATAIFTLNPVEHFPCIWLLIGIDVIASGIFFLNKQLD